MDRTSGCVKGVGVGEASNFWKEHVAMGESSGGRHSPQMKSGAVVKLEMLLMLMVSQGSCGR